LFGDRVLHRRRSTLSPLRKVVDPTLYGERRLLRYAQFTKPFLDRIGFWTPQR